MQTGDVKTSALSVIHDTQNLLETIESYRSLMVASDTGAWEYLIDTNTLICNDVYFTLLGRTSGSVIARSNNLDELWTDWLHPDDVEGAIKLFKAYIINPAKPYQSYFRMLHEDGTWRWIWSRGQYVTDANGRPTNRIIGTHTNITELKNAEEEISRERILLRTLIDNLPNTIYVKDNLGRKIIANRTDVMSIGATSEAEVLGKTDIELFPTEIGERGYRDDMAVLNSGKPMFNKEEFFFDSTGDKQWLLTSKIPVRDAQGNIIRILGVGHNITERKKADEALHRLNEELNQQSQELKLLNEQLIKQNEQELEKAITQGKFEIASEVLHDIGNALVGFGSYLNRINRSLDKSNIDTIKSLTQFLTAQHAAIANAIGTDKANALIAITEGVSKTQLTNKEEISASVRELVNIITHIQEILNIQRQFVREHSGARERKAVNLTSIIEDCRSMLMASYDKKGIILKVDVKPGDYVIKGDHTKLMQVMLNVLKNSVEAIDLDASDKRVQVSLSADAEKIDLVVTDNGQGFDALTGKHLFERGFTTKKSGTGLGLYNCRSIVESHSGTFQIKSDGIGLGATTAICFFKN